MSTAVAGGRATASGVHASLLMSEVALALTTMAVAYGFCRVFAGWDFLPQLLLTAFVSHLLSASCRRLGLGFISSTVLSLAVFSVFGALLLYPDTTWYGFPREATWDLAVEQLREAWHLFPETRPPVPAETGFLLAAVTATWAVGHLADTLAFRLHATLEGVVPAAAVFLFIAALARGDHRFDSTALFAGAALVFVALHLALLAEAQPGWLSADRRPVGATVLRGAVGLGAVAMLAAVVIGPALPGAGDEPVVEYRGGGGESSRVTLSPLVDIRGRLTDQSEAEVFTVASDAPAYWRLMALDTFDGQVWSSEAQYREDDGDLPTADDELQGPAITQRFTIGRLASIWLPTAYRPIHYEGDDSIAFDSDSASLLTSGTTRNGQEYEVVSVQPQPTPEQLAAIRGDVPGDIAERYLQLPDEFPDRLRELAASVASDAGATTPYAAALALQDYFRAFRYDLNVEPGHGDDAIEDFLEARAGYCEQFAGTYAAFARALGLPARVAVGFTPGDLEDDGLYHVRGRHAHAWPEVWFAGIGWVPFEPTPGRGAPGAEVYTRVEPQQAGRDGTETQPSTSEAPASTVAPVNPDDPFLDPALDPFLTDLPVEAVGPRRPATSSPWKGRLAVLGGAVSLIALGWIVGVPLARGALHRRRRARAADPNARVRLAWIETTEAFEAAGIEPHGPETQREFARRAARLAGVDSHVVSRLASDADAAVFGPAELDEAVAKRSTLAAATITTRLREITPMRRRVLRALDPRPLRHAAVRQRVHEADHGSVGARR